MAEHVTRRAPAKINLALAVGPARARDGFHPICSWFAPIGLTDELHVQKLSAASSSRYEIAWAYDAPRPSPIDWPLEKDLCVRAHRALEQEMGRDLSLAMKLTKRIPVGGGLGGGSSDAAAMLIAVRELFGLAIDDDRLRAIGRTLGSDVAFFVSQRARTAIVEGLGEAITPVAPVRADLILILPPFGCPTGAVYKAFDAMNPGQLRAEAVREMALAGRIETSRQFNDLAPAAERVEPRLAEARKRAERIAGVGRVHITGSGSTMFVVCEGGGRVTLAERLRAGLADCAIVETECG